MNDELTTEMIYPVHILLNGEWDTQDKIRLLIFGLELSREQVSWAYEEIVRKHKNDDFGAMVLGFGKALLSHDKSAADIIDDLFHDRDIMVRFEQLLSETVTSVERLKKNGEIDDAQAVTITDKTQEIRNSWLDKALKKELYTPEGDTSDSPVIRNAQTGKWHLSRMPRSSKLWRKHVVAHGGNAPEGLRSMTEELSRTYDTEAEATEKYESIVREVEKLGHDTPQEKFYFLKLFLPSK